jgi:hypothetical protein
MKLKSKIKPYIFVPILLIILFIAFVSMKYIIQLYNFYPWAIKISNLTKETSDDRYNNAINNNEIYFLGVIWEGLEFPGINNIKDIQQYRTIIIDSTGDVIRSKEHLNIKNTARQYAERFNTKMLYFINESNH